MYKAATQWEKPTRCVHISSTRIGCKLSVDNDRGSDGGKRVTINVKSTANGQRPLEIGQLVTAGGRCQTREKGTIEWHQHNGINKEYWPFKNASMIMTTWMKKAARPFVLRRRANSCGGSLRPIGRFYACQEAYWFSFQLYSKLFYSKITCRSKFQQHIICFKAILQQWKIPTTIINSP